MQKGSLQVFCRLPACSLYHITDDSSGVAGRSVNKQLADVIINLGCVTTHSYADDLASARMGTARDVAWLGSPCVDDFLYIA